MGSSQPASWQMMMAMMQQNTMERQNALLAEQRLERSRQEAKAAEERRRQQAASAEERMRRQAIEAAHREQLMQKDIDFELMRMKAEQDLAAERARVRALQDAHMQAMMDNFFKSQQR